MIYLSQNGDRDHFVDQIFKIFATPLDKAKRIFVKPNIVSYEQYPTTTHPEILEAVLKRLCDAEFAVGDGPAIDAGRASKILQKSPLNEVCNRYGVKLLNLYSEKDETVQSTRGYKVRCQLLPLACDFVISLPVLKIHGMVGLSGALKNQFATLAARQIFYALQDQELKQGIAEVNAAVATKLVHR